MGLSTAALAATSTSKPPRLTFINTSFENASPLHWEIAEDGAVMIYLVYDQERGSPNRANGHWHFQLQAEPGSQFTLVLNHLLNIWNGKPGVPVSEHTRCQVSDDGRVWRTVETEVTDQAQLRLDVTLTTNVLYVAHLEPYRVSDLDRLLAEIRGHPQVAITHIGRTVQGRDLEIVRIGRDDAPHRALFRARAHAWESGGSWVVQGLIRSLLREDPENVDFLRRYAVYILPMANKDGVAHGKTRFNLLGKDLNRNWDQPPDPILAPENHALETWLRDMIARGRKPDLAIDLHNDQSGRIHVSRPEIDLEAYLGRVDRYEALMREFTWFTEGRTGGTFRNPGTFGEGLLERFGIVGLVQELNANWIAGLPALASAQHWDELGRQYRKVLYHYFDETGSR